jgi:protein-L-isoaspartate(D-aspartate) O-methyltransferase
MSDWNEQPKAACDEFEFLRREMVERQIRRRGISDARVLAAMTAIPRHAFVPFERISESYADSPLGIGYGQTISQPFMVAAMAGALRLQGHERVLEIGAGSGYQAAVLSLLAREVTTVEVRQSLAAVARERMTRLGYTNVQIEEGDGSIGWIAKAPYDAILVSAAAPDVPQSLIDQLADGGCLVLPVGDTDSQQLTRITRGGREVMRENLFACRFVPLIGRHGWPDTVQKASSAA